jgi:non-ribosomal peptide synthetase component E (peptide arylation enzyme)
MKRSSMQVPLLAETVGQKFAAIVRRFGNRVAIRASSRQVSYQELDELSDALATGLADLGIQASDRVAVSLGNDIEYGVVSHFHCFL